MRKLLLLICALLTGVSGAWGQVTSITNGGMYYIRVGLDNNVGYVNAEYKCVKSKSTLGLFRLNEVTVDEATYYTIYNVVTSKYVNFVNTSEGESKLTSADAVSENSYWSIAIDNSNTAGKWDICPKGSDNCWNFYGGVTADRAVGLYRKSDGNSVWYLEEPLVTSLAETNALYYTVQADTRGIWGATTDGSSGLAYLNKVDNANYDPTATAQQFAFVPYNGSYYLWNVNTKQFVLKERNGIMSNVQAQAIQFTSTGNDNYPTMVRFDDSHIINFGGGTYGFIIDGWGSQGGGYIDKGNSVKILPQGAYDLTEAITTLEKWVNGGVTSKDQIRTDKAYNISCPRGAFGVKDSHLSNTVMGTGFSESTFAFVSNDAEDGFFLWSVEDGKYIKADGSETSNQSEATEIDLSMANTFFKLSFGSNAHINTTTWQGGATNNYGYLINSDDPFDAGSIYSIIAVGDFDPTTPFSSTIAVGPSTGSYYDVNDAVTDQYGKTWKSTTLVNGNPLLTLSTSTGMRASDGALYATTGDGFRYTLTAADGYIITGYSINGTADGADIKVTPRIRKAETITNGSALTDALNVDNLDLQIVSFTLSSETLNTPLTDVALNVNVAADKRLFDPVIANGTPANIGYKHTATVARNMKYMTSTAGGVLTSSQATTTLLQAPGSAGAFKIEVNEAERAYYIKVVGTNNYVYASDVAMTSNLVGPGNQSLSVATLPTSGDKSVFQWSIEEAGTYANAQSYIIRPKLNTHTAIAVQSTGNNNFAFYETNEGYGFNHAFLVNAGWKSLTDWYLDDTKRANLSKAGTVGYPPVTATVLMSNAINALEHDRDNFFDEDVFTALSPAYNVYLTSHDIILPQEGKTYTIANYAKNGTLRYLYNNSGTIGLSTESSITDDYKFVCHRKTIGETDKFIFAMPNGNYLVWKGNNEGINSGSGQASLTDITSNDRYPLTIEQFAKSGVSSDIAFGKMHIVGHRSNSQYSSLIVKTSENRFDHADNSNFFDDNYSSAWIITEVDGGYYNKVTLRSDNTDAYASIYLPFAVTIPDGIKAFAVTSSDATEALMEEIVGDGGGILPANTGAILKKYSQTTDSDPIYLSPAEAAGSSVDGNLLRGSSTDISLTDRNGNYMVKVGDGDTDADYNYPYVLSKPNGTIGFYRYNGTTLPGGRAYLPLSEKLDADGTRGLLFNFGDVDGISNTKQSTSNNAPVYDLQGRRVNNASHGIYIQNGKKILR